MSTKDSIYYGHGLHIFKECMTDDICIEADKFIYNSDGTVGTIKVNEKYGALTMPKEAWIELANNILERFNEPL